MARYYRQTSTNSKNTGSIGARFYSIGTLEAEQAPAAYLKKVKVSIIPADNTVGVGNRNPSYFIYASADSNLSLIHI